MTFPMQIPERDDLLQKAEGIRSILEADAEQNEDDRTLAMTSVNALYDSGVLNMCVPRELGGVEADPVTQTEIYEAITSMDTSAGWCLVIGATSVGMLGGRVSDEALQTVFHNGHIPRACGTVVPAGTAERVDGGYRINGRWAFGSAIHHAEWVSSSAMVMVNGERQKLPNGAPKLISFCLPIEDVVVEDNWHTSGLRGTGSSHYRIEDKFIADAFLLGSQDRGGTLFRIPTFGYVAGCHAGFALGVAKRALQEITTMAAAKKRKLSGVNLGDRGSFHKELGIIASKLAGARLFSLDILNQLWESTNKGEHLSLVQWGECRAAMTYVTEVAAEVATFAYRYGTGAALFQSHPLQRYMRDIYAATQHGIVSEENYENLGLALIGKGQWDYLIGPRPA